MIWEVRVYLDNVRVHAPAQFKWSVTDERGVFGVSVVGHLVAIPIVKHGMMYKKTRKTSYWVSNGP